MAQEGIFLEGIYQVTYNGQTVGTAQVRKEGLYFRISCRCRVRDDAIHRLYADGEKIGVLMPDRGGLVLETRIPAKRLKKGCAFSLDQTGGEFIPIRAGEAFPHLDRLRKGKLTYRAGEPGLLPDG